MQTAHTQALFDLVDEEKKLHAIFHKMPNDEEREKLCSKWMDIRKEISLIIYNAAGEYIGPPDL